MVSPRLVREARHIGPWSFTVTRIRAARCKEVSDMAQRQREVLLGLYAGGTNEIQRNLVSRWLLAGGGGATDA